MLEDEDEHAVGGADREQVEQHRLQRQDDGAEGAQEQQVGEDQDGDDEPREGAVGGFDEVDPEGGGAGEDHFGVAEPRPGDIGVADSVDQVLRFLRAGVALAGDADLGDLAGLVDQAVAFGDRAAAGARRQQRGREDRRRLHLGVAAQLGDQAVLGGDHRRRVGAVGAPGFDHDLVRGEGAGAEGVAQQRETAGRFLGQRHAAVVAAGHVQAESRQRQADHQPAGDDQVEDRPAHDRAREAAPDAGSARWRGARGCCAGSRAIG